MMVMSNRRVNNGGSSVFFGFCKVVFYVSLLSVVFVRVSMEFICK